MKARMLATLDELIADGERSRSKARKLISRALTKNPGDHRLLTRMARSFSDDASDAASLGRRSLHREKVRDALAWHRLALKAAPTCPVVHWDYAETVPFKKGVAIYRSLVRRGGKSLGADPCVRTVRRGEGMVTDAYWMIALLHWVQDEFPQGLRAVRQCERRCLKGLGGSCSTVSGARMVLGWLEEKRADARRAKTRSERADRSREP